MKREMKHSGVAWIGEIPKHWSVKKLKFSCKIFGRIGFRGYTADDLVDESEGAITLSPINMNNFNLDFSKCSYLSWNKYYESPEIMVEIGDVLLVKTASVGKCSYVDYLPKETTVNPQILVLKEHNDYSKFIAYLFHTSIGKAYIDTTKGGSTIYTISQEKIENYEFAFPPIEEQQKIAEFLDRKSGEIDEMIYLQEKVIEELKAYKQSIITEAVTKGLNPNVAMRDSEIEWIGEIPEHWEIKKLKFALDGLCDGTHGTFDRVNNGELLLSAKNIGEKGIVLGDNESQISHEDYTKIISNGFPCKGDVLLCCVGTIGKCSIFNEDKPIAFQRSVAFLRHNRTMIPEYLMYLLKSNIMQAQYEMYARKSAQSGIYMGVIKDFVIVAPYIIEQQAIADYLDKKCADIDSLIQTKQLKIEELKEYKKSLIYEYVTGKKEI